jgi:putative transposase
MSEKEKRRCRTYRYHLRPTKHQEIALTRQLHFQRELYNAALEERIGAWKWEKRSVTFFDQCTTLTTLKDVRPEVLESGVTVCRGTLQRVDRAYSAFFRRVKSGETPGFPRFKGASSFDSLEWGDTSGWTITPEHRLRLLGIGFVKVNYHRDFEGTPKAITVKREGRKWWLSVRCVDVPAKPLPKTGKEIGIDLGVINVIATSDEELQRAQSFAKRSADLLAAAQRSLATKQRGSNRRRRQVEEVARLHRKVRNQRANAHHQLSRRLVNDYDLLVLEDLKISNMLRAPKPKPDPANPGSFLANGRAVKVGLNRSISDAGWGLLQAMIVYKAECAGRTVVVVDPRHTSQRCVVCHHVARSNRVSQAVFRCGKCGHEDHADFNAARNILRAGRAQLALASDG